MKEAHKVRIDDFKGREWTFYVTEIHAELDAYLARLKNGKYINSYNINIAENVCADLSAFRGLPEILKELSREKHQ